MAQQVPPNEQFTLVLGGALTVAAIALTLGTQALFRGGGAPAVDLRRDRAELHLKRRGQHVATGMLFFAISFTPLADDLYIRYTGLLLLAMAFAVYLTHRRRLTDAALDQFLKSHLGDLLRKHEYDGEAPGALYFLLGVAAVCIMSERSPIGKVTGRLALLCLSLGDPAAGLFGTWLSPRNESALSKPFGSKSWQGSLACFLSCFLAASIYLTVSSDFQAHHNAQAIVADSADANALVFRTLKVSIMTGLLGAIFEAAPVHLDDNLAIPVGVLLSLDSARLLGYFA